MNTSPVLQIEKGLRVNFSDFAFRYSPVIQEALGYWQSISSFDTSEFSRKAINISRFPKKIPVQYIFYCLNRYSYGPKIF